MTPQRIPIWRREENNELMLFFLDVGKAPEKQQRMGWKIGMEMGGGGG
jgi:hypothetical protein